MMKSARNPKIRGREGGKKQSRGKEVGEWAKLQRPLQEEEKEEEEERKNLEQEDRILSVTGEN